MLFVTGWFSVKYVLNYQVLFRWDLYHFAELLARSQYPEGLTAGHLERGFLDFRLSLSK
jgi:hypothetical protein